MTDTEEIVSCKLREVRSKKNRKRRERERERERGRERESVSEERCRSDENKAHVLKQEALPQLIYRWMVKELGARVSRQIYFHLAAIIGSVECLVALERGPGF